MLIKLLLRFAAAVAVAVDVSAGAAAASALFGIHIWSLTNCWRAVAEVITFFLAFLA